MRIGLNIVRTQHNNMATEPVTIILNFIPWMIAFAFAILVLNTWRHERERDRSEKHAERERQEALRKREEERREEERSDATYRAYVEKQERDEAAVRANVGGGTGGYIVVDLPDAQRALFHDLLKGFEEYAQLKGYRVAFSADATFPGHIAFKFTLTDPDVIVSGERVRKDLREYIEKVSRGESLDEIPRIISIQEHDVLVATLKNRISFLQHSYNLAKTSADFYERMFSSARTLPVLPSPSVVVQTGGQISAPTYSAVNSPQALLGHHNSAASQVYIAHNYAERRAQIDQLERLLELLRAEPPTTEAQEATRAVSNVKEELESVASPEPTRVGRWLQKFKEICQVGSLGAETVAAAKELFKVFGVGG